MKPKEDGQENFVMVGIEAISELVGTATRAKRLQPRDGTVLWMVMASVNWRSGRADVTAATIAKELGIKVTQCAASIRRLQDEGLLTRGIDPRSRHAYFLINPRLGWVGSTQRRGHLYKQWDELTHIPTLDELEAAG
jgi:hypothetical protein